MSQAHVRASTANHVISEFFCATFEYFNGLPLIAWEPVINFCCHIFFNCSFLITKLTILLQSTRHEGKMRMDICAISTYCSLAFRSTKSSSSQGPTINQCINVANNKKRSACDLAEFKFFH